MPTPHVERTVMALEALAPAPYNPRAISAEAMDGLRTSIARFGLVQEIVVNRRTMRIVGGHQRVEVLRQQGVKDVPVVLVDLDENNEKALNVALNSPHISGEFVPERLAPILLEIERIDESLYHDLRLDVLKIELIGAHEEIVAGLTDPDEVPEAPEEPVTKPGDLWLLGEHRILCGDSTSATDVRRLLAGEAPKLMVTDPPYGVSLDMEWRDRAGHNALGSAEPSYMKHKRHTAEGHLNTTISGDTIADWSPAFELVPSLNIAYVWHASTYAIEVGIGLRRIGFEIKQQIIWKKPHFVLSRQHYHWQHEPCWYARKPGSAPFLGTRDQSTVWEAASPKMLMSGGDEEKVDHPTQKPVVLYTVPILNHLQLGEPVYEPFSGSGTAIMACEQTGRRCFAMELDPKYVDVAVRRWENFTGKKAVLEVRGSALTSSTMTAAKRARSSKASLACSSG